MIGMLKSAAAAGRAALVLAVVAAAPSVSSAQNAGPAAEKNLVEVAVGAGSFKTLVAAVQAAGLVETLKGPGPFTVFAPTDAAFAKLPPGALDGLLADPAALRSVLTLHVVPGRVAAGDIVRTSGASPRTVNGAALDIVVREGRVYVNGAQVVTADVRATNGIIHVIDTVILPASAPAEK